MCGVYCSFILSSVEHPLAILPRISSYPFSRLCFSLYFCCRTPSSTTSLPSSSPCPPCTASAASATTSSSSSTSTNGTNRHYAHRVVWQCIQCIGSVFNVTFALGCSLLHLV